jgi:HlyD family secretion protein
MAVMGRAIKFWAFALVLIGAAAATGYLYWGRAPQTNYVTAPVSQGPVIRTVTATGTVNPLTTVQVGTYVSGPIQAIYADFNSPVKAGQLIAKIDPRTFKFQVDQARATVENYKAQLAKDRADLAYKKLTYERDLELVRNNTISQDTADAAQSAYRMAEAQIGLDQAAIKQWQASLAQAEVNLNYTNIVSPVDGTVVSRNVDVGQTVAASFQTPTLFLIAKDLTQMQVDSNVSESDIGYVRKGQSASFRVDAFPDRDFEGVVGQVRQAPITVQNVVTYDVVLNVSNPESMLKPGMTANLTIATARRDNVLRVPVQALHFRPERPQHDKPAPVATSDPQGASGGKKVWVLEGTRLKKVRVTTGLDDGTNVEVLSGDLRPGDLVVTDVVKPASSSRPPGPRGPRF